MSETLNENLAVRLVNRDVEIPHGWEKTQPARHLTWRPSHSDLIFNYLDCAIRCDSREDHEQVDTAQETELAISLLSTVLEIEADDIAYHFLSRC